MAALGVALAIAWLGYDRSVEGDPALPVPAVDVPLPSVVEPVPDVLTPRSDIAAKEVDPSVGAQRAVASSASAPQRRPRFVAPEIGTLVGVLHDAAGGPPIAGAQIELERAESAGVLRRAVTAADGSFRLHPLEAGKSYVVRARFSSLVGELHAVNDLPAGESPLDLTLDRASAWIIRIRDIDSGEPVAGVELTVHAADERPVPRSSAESRGDGDRLESEAHGPNRSRTLASSKSDREGVCLVGGSALRSRDRVSLRTQRIHYASVEVELLARDVPPGKEFEIAIGKLVSYSGTVVDLQSRPIAGAGVSGRDQRQPEIGYPRARNEVGLLSTGEESHAIEVPAKTNTLERADVTDELGRFELVGMKRGTVSSFVIDLEGGECFSIPFEDPDATRHRMPIEIRVPLGAAELSGVIRLNGNPYPARVVWSGSTRAGFANAGADGTYRLRTIESGRVTVHAIASDGRKLASSTLEVPARGSLRHDFDITLSRKIRGVVRRATGEVAADLRVDLRMHGSKDDGGDGSESLGAPEAMLVDSPFRPMFKAVAKRSRWVATTNTDRDGRFEFEVSDVAAGYFVMAIGRVGGLVCTTGDVFPGGEEAVIVLQYLPEYRPSGR